MSDLRDLYQSLILDHGQTPRHFHVLPPPCCERTGHNPVCGDQLTLYAKCNESHIQCLSFQGTGCAISVASASLMIDALQNQTRTYAKQLFNAFHSLITQPGATPDPILGKLTAFSGVHAFPARAKCATLCWHTLDALIATEENHHVISTE